MMKKSILQVVRFGLATGSLAGYLMTAAKAFAQAVTNTPTPTTIIVRITPPEGGVSPSTPIGVVISNALTLLFSAAALVVLFMMAFGAFQWITSGGDKDAIDKARKRIISALIGLALLALAYLIAVIASNITGIDLFNLKLPRLDQSL